MERTAKLTDVEQAAADRQHARDMEMRRQQQEELRMKGNIAMENMKAMMEAKRAAKKDELDAATDHLNIRSQMSAAARSGCFCTGRIYGCPQREILVGQRG